MGQALRLQHVTTRRWLHSHHFSSPLTNKQEVKLPHRTLWVLRDIPHRCIFEGLRG